MSKLNLWRMAAFLSTGLLIISMVLFGMLGQNFGFMKDMYVHRQTSLIDQQGVVIQKQADTIRELQKLLFGNNETEQKPFPPGPPV